MLLHLITGTMARWSTSCGCIPRPPMR